MLVNLGHLGVFLLQEDLKLWLPLPDSPPADLDLEMSRFLLTQVGDQFCDLLEQEKESIAVHMSEGLL
jgi:lysine-specific demethylase 3